ncbi:MAG: MFS transporter [Chloroflexi bacterium]|nr:MFS transporter [Chloroflexota bacterium]
MTPIRVLLQRAGQALAGPLTPQTRSNVITDLTASVMYGPFNAALLFVPVVLQNMGASPDMLAIYQAQVYIGLFLAAFSVLIIPRGNLLLFLAIIWTIGRGAFVLTGLAPGAVELLLLAAVFWFSDGFPGAAYVEVVRRVYPADVRGRALSVVRIGMVVTMLAVTPLIGAALDHLGPTFVYPIAGLFGIAAAWLFMRMKLGKPDETTTRHKGSVRDLWAVMRKDRRFTVYLLGVVCFGLGGLVGIAFYPGVLVDRLKLSYESISWLGFAQSISWILGLVVWGRLMDRLGGPWVLFICFALATIVPLSYMLATAGWMMVPAYIVSGLLSGGVDLAFTNSPIDLAEPGLIYEYAALQRTIIGVRGLIGPFLGVWLFNAGVPVQVVFILAAVFYIAGALLMHRKEFRQRVKRAPST